jgi:RimJ/RimL family protein N-acetyltransferase
VKAAIKMMETDRLVIRNFEYDDWEALREMILQYQSSEYAVYDHRWPISEQEIKKITDWFACGDRYFAVCLKDAGRFVGFVSLIQAQDNEEPEFDLGYCINFDYHRKGYATEACRAMIGYAFERLHATRVLANTAAGNRPSCCLLARLGLKKIAEGTAAFRETENGEPIEFLSHTYAISRDDWEVARQRS